MWEPFAIRSILKEGQVDTSPGTEWFKPEIRGALFEALETTVAWQVAHIEDDDEQTSFDFCTALTYKAHIDHGIKVHERDETRLLAQGPKGSDVSVDGRD